MSWIVNHSDALQTPTPVEYAREQRGNKKAPKIAPPPETKVIEAEYFRDLNRMVKFQNNTIRQIIMPEIPRIMRKAKADSLKTDYYVDDLDGVMGKARAQFVEQYPDERIAAMATKAGIVANNVNKRYYNRMYRLLGLNPLISEPWLNVKMKGFTQTNVELIKGFTDDEYTKVRGIISRGAQAGKTVVEVQSEVRGTFPMNKNRAKLIAQDQIQKFNSELNKARQTDAGVKKYIWRTSKDNRVRDRHKARENNVYKWSDPPADGHPGIPVRCRCRAEPVI